MSNYPPGSDTKFAPWNARDAEECPQCLLPGELMDSDETYESWVCEDCGHHWHVQIGRDPDEARDAMRDDSMTGDL